METDIGERFEARRQAYLAHVMVSPAPGGAAEGIFHALARQAAGQALDGAALQAAVELVQARRPGAEIAIHGLLRLLYAPGGEPGAEAAQVERAAQAVLGFKYWPDEAGSDGLRAWTESGYLLLAAAGYLAGQRFPGQVFSAGGQDGRQKMEANRQRIERWLELRFWAGFSEWLTPTAYDRALLGLLELVELCQDQALRRQAEMVIDVLLLDVALNSFHGQLAAGSGAGGAPADPGAPGAALTSTVRLLFGQGQFSGAGLSAAACALSPRYRLPAVLPGIAGDMQRPGMANRQRMGLNLELAENWGLDLESPEDGLTLLTQGAFAHPRTLGLTLRLLDAFAWWDRPEFAAFARRRLQLKVLKALGLLPRLAERLGRDLGRRARPEANLYTYRTADYLLSTAQDYRPGAGGDRQRIWQAVLGPDAVCFTTHPARLDGPPPNAWGGTGQLPRAAQVGSVTIVVYNLQPLSQHCGPAGLDFTHAWLPQERFDELVEQQGWVFARKGQGYLALRSMQPAVWQPAEPGAAPRELAAAGAQNIWICELGRQAGAGEFARFVEQIAAARLAWDALRVSYHSPSQGRLEFGWSGPLLQDGRQLPLSDYPRYLNPYVQSSFPTGGLTARHAGQTLALNWRQGLREASAYA